MRILLCLLLALPWCGSTTKRKARAEAQAAFLAGQRQAMQMQLQTQRGNIRVLGPVRNPDVTWHAGLTLAQVIAAAECTFQHDPKAIIIIRKGERIWVEPQALLNGQDVPVEPGDMVEFDL